MATSNGFTAPVISGPNLERQGSGLSYWNFNNQKGNTTSNVIDPVDLEKGSDTSLASSTFALPTKGLGTKSTTSVQVPSYIDLGTRRPENDSTVTITVPVIPKTPEQIKSNYAHTADEIQETTQKHWFTEDQRLMLIELYNAMSGGVDNTEDRVITWVVQPLQPVGPQNLVARVPFKSKIVSINVSCVNPGPVESMIILRKCSEISFKDKSFNWNSLLDLRMSISPLNNTDMKLPATEVDLVAGDYLDLIIEGGGPAVAFNTPITVHLAIRSDRTTT